MAVMSNEIRRAGFRVCDVSADNATQFECPDIDGDGEEDPFIPAYALGEDISIGQNTTAGDCILYRYNADVDDIDDKEEHRGFRLIANNDGIGVVQIAQSDNTTDVKCNDDAQWEPLTNPKVINITALSFSTAGSKCRNMTKKIYWVVGDGATGLACADGTGLDNGGCIDLNDPAEAFAGCDVTNTTVDADWVNDPTDADYPDYPEDTQFGVNQIRVNLRATLTRDPAVSKILKTSVKVANPWIEIAKEKP